MIKKFLVSKLFITLLLASITADAALKWNVAAFIWTGTAVVVTGAALLAAAPIVIAGTISVGFHAGVIGLYWDDINPPEASSGDPGSKGMSVVIDPNTPFVTPTDWTAPTGGEKEPQPPQTTDFKTEYSTFVYASYADQQAGNGHRYDHIQTLYDLYFVVTENSNFTVTSVTTDSSGNYQFNGSYADQPPESVNYVGSQTSNTCPSGYTVSNLNHNCTLTAPTQVMKPSDEVCEVQVRTGTFQESDSDPDCQNTVITGLGTNQLQAVTPDKAVILQTSATGEVTVYEKSYDAATDKTTTNIGNFGVNGELNYLNSTVQAGKNLTVTPIGGGTGTGGGGTSDAKDSSLNPHPGGDEPVVNDGSVAGGTSEVLATSDSIFTPLKNWTVPSVPGTCSTATFTLFNKDYHFDAMCTLLDDNKTAIQTGMTVVYSVLALFIVLSA